jgi:uncharacterized protein YxjI
MNQAPYTGPMNNKRYIFRQKLVSIGNDYWIENEQGEKVFRVDGIVLTLKKTFYLEDAHGNRLAEIKKRLITIKETMDCWGPKGQKLAQVTKALFTPLKEHFVVDLPNGARLDVHGNILDHEYTVEQEQRIAAQVSKKWIDVRDSYVVSIEPGQDDVIILLVVLCIDEMTH